jgi:hypothetical protein
MACQPTSEESMRRLRDLRQHATEYGDECLSLLLSGIELYVCAGRELELLEIIRANAEEMREAIENTPSAQDLHRLFESNNGQSSA